MLDFVERYIYPDYRSVGAAAVTWPGPSRNPVLGRRRGDRRTFDTEVPKALLNQILSAYAYVFLFEENEIISKAIIFTV